MTMVCCCECPSTLKEQEDYEKEYGHLSDSGERFFIESMDCPVEVNDIKNILAPVLDVKHLSFRLETRTLAIDASAETVAQCVRLLAKNGYDAKRTTQNADASTSSHAFRYGLALVIAAIVEVGELFLEPTTLTKTGGLVLALIAIALSGFTTYRKGIAALIGRRFTVAALMAVAVTGAFLIGQWSEAAMVMALYSIAELIEARSLAKARNTIRELFELTPDMALLRQEDGSFAERPVSSIALGEVLRVRPGERIALDGTVVSGTSTIDQSTVTGESIPVEKHAGDEVFAGTINVSGALEFEVTAISTNTVVARIIRSVEQAQEKQAPIQKTVDRLAAVYTPAVFLFALAVALAGPFLFGWTWLDALYKALVMLVISCPCALVIGTPLTIVCGLAAAARNAVVMKGGVYLEQARNLKVVALDKTGTITQGKPRLVGHDLFCAEPDRDSMLGIAATLAGSSGHPVSRAIATGLEAQALAMGDITEIAGFGITGDVDGQSYYLGNTRYLRGKIALTDAVAAVIKDHEDRGHTVTVLSSAKGIVAVFAVADTIRKTSREAIFSLKKSGIATVLLTGDNEVTAKAIAAEVGIDSVFSNLLPEDKLHAIGELKKRYGMTAMVGDGINDAPALATSDLGVAMGGAGTDIAMEAADAVVMNDDLASVNTMINLSKSTNAILWQNIVLALGIKGAFFVMALAGMATMWMAIFADVGACLLVVANGLRMLRK